MGFLDALAYADRQHRLDSANAGNSGDCLTGQVRFMNALTPAYAHAYQTICLAMHLPSAPHHTFRLPKPKSGYSYFPNDRSITRELGNDYHGWSIFSDGGTRVVGGEIFAGWSVISLMGASLSCLVPWLPPRLHLVFSGARSHSNNTAEMTAMFEALSFLGPRGPINDDEQSRIF